MRQCLACFFAAFFACWFAGRFALLRPHHHLDWWFRPASVLDHRLSGMVRFAGLIALIFGAIIFGTPPTTVCALLPPPEASGGIICTVASRVICHGIVIVGGFDLLIILAITLTSTTTPAAAATSAPFWLASSPVVSSPNWALSFARQSDHHCPLVIGLGSLLRLTAILTRL